MAVRGFSSGDLAAELESLRRSIDMRPRSKAQAAPTADPQPGGAPPDEEDPLVALLADLRREAEAALAEADEAAHRHPLALAGAAFLLGLAVGTLARGGRG